MQVSVVIPTRNRAESLTRLLGSLALQTYPIAEVLIVDSSDDLGYHAGLQAQFETLPIRWLDSEASVCIQRNTGIQAAQSPWVWLCDDDIELEADYLQQLMAYAQANPEAGCLTGWWVQKESDGNWHSLYPPKNLAGLTLSWFFQLSIWGNPEDTPAPALFQSWKQYLVRYYQSHGNTLTRAGW
ncbi:MAG: glycosyltransferase family A protein, partial [Bacteroidota bacterium]